MDQPLQANTFNEARYYLMVMPCPRCRKGPWEIDSIDPAAQERTPRLAVHCRNCQTALSLSFRCIQDTQGLPDEDECINPGPAASRIIDLGQWLSLFYLLVESAAAETARPIARRAGYRAALCLGEALKFYGEGEMPPESAFFSAETAAAFHQHPENFARQRLRDMQAKLPDISAMARRLAVEKRVDRRRWWQFWRS